MSGRGGGLLLKAPAGVSIALVASAQCKCRQPGFAADNPAFVGGYQLIRGIQGSQVHFDFVVAAGEHRGAAAGTEMTAGVVLRLALDGHRILREYGRGVEQRTMMFSAVQAVTKADPIRASRGDDSYVAAEATAGE
ncbi:hypothetical protein D3C78_808880 [compost metagenome]